MKHGKGGFLILLCIIWIAVILGLAAQGGEDSHSLSYNVTWLIGSILHPDFSSWSLSVQTDWVSGIESLIRKLAHFSEFALLGALAFFSLHEILKNRKGRKPYQPVKSAFLAFYLCAAIAMLSEMLQIYADNRTASTLDVLLDCFGVICGIMVSYVWVKHHGSAKSAEEAPVSHRRKG